MIIKCEKCANQVQVRSTKLFCTRCNSFKHKYETYEFVSLTSKPRIIKKNERQLHMYI